MQLQALSLVGFSAAIAYVALAGYVLGARSRSLANRLFALICVTQAFWAVTVALYTSAPSRDDAWLWYRVSIPSWLILPALILCFFRTLTESVRVGGWVRSRAMRAGLLLLPVVVFAHPALSGRMTARDHRLTALGWCEVASGDVWDSLYTLYYLAYSVIALWLVGLWARHDSNPAVRRQARVIHVTGLSALAIVALFEELLPGLGLLRLPPIAPTVLMIWVGGIWYAMARHRLMTLSPEVAARDILRTMANALLLVDRAGIIRVANQAAGRLLECPEGEAGLVGQRVAEFFPGERAFDPDAAAASHSVLHYELVLRSPNGREVPLAVSASVVRDQHGDSPGVVVILRDVTMEKLAERQLLHLANHDPLTGLPNRILLHDRVAQALARAHRYQKPFAVLLLDLDHFKEVNDTLGHAAGDSLLELVAGRLRGLVRQCDTVARLGGDEFVLVVGDLNHVDDAGVVARRCVDQLSAPFLVGGRSLHISCTVGISVYPTDGDSLDRLLKRADLALYRSKLKARGTYAFFQAALETETDPAPHGEAASCGP